VAWRGGRRAMRVLAALALAAVVIAPAAAGPAERYAEH
jgi:hypothetical protein